MTKHLSWGIVLAAQAIAFALGVIVGLTSPAFLTITCAAPGLLGFIAVFAICSAWFYQEGAGPFFARLIIAWVASAAFWVVAVVIFNSVRSPVDPMEYVVMFIFWVPSLTFWSAGWYAWLILGPFVPKAAPEERDF